MRILISTFGTRGDIQPFIALGKGLKAAGYTVAVCTSEGFRPFVEEHGLRYAFMNNELLELTQLALRGTANGLDLIRRMHSALRRTLTDEWQAAQDFKPDLIVYHPKVLGSYHIAEKLDIPAIMSIPLPFYTPTRDFPNPFLGGIRLGTWANRLTYKLMGLSSAMFVGLTNEFRARSLRLPRQHRFTDLLIDAYGQPVPVLYPYSLHVLPIPTDYPSHVYVTGYWFLDQANKWQPPTDLMRFLEAGPPPVYVGFGSAGGAQGSQRTQLVLDALAASGQRGILASGWGGLSAIEVPETVFMIDEVPHDWLFPQIAAVVHHGGAGTTAAGLRAGKPTIICPFFGDQPFWGDIIYRRGLGPRPIPQKRLRVQKLAAAVTTVVQDKMLQQRATEVGIQIRKEDGVTRAVEVIRAIVGTSGNEWGLTQPSIGNYL